MLVVALRISKVSTISIQCAYHMRIVLHVVSGNKDAAALLVSTLFKFVRIPSISLLPQIIHKYLSFI